MMYTRKKNLERKFWKVSFTIFLLLVWCCVHLQLGLGKHLAMEGHTHKVVSPFLWVKHQLVRWFHMWDNRRSGDRLPLLLLPSPNTPKLPSQPSHCG